MAKIKDIVKAGIPPIIISLFRKLRNSVQNQLTWSGDYKTWEDAQTRCVGYDSEVILEKVKSSLLKVKNGEAIYERDSVLFDEIQYSLGALGGLQRAALENNGTLCVLDFGGSLGSSYFQNREFLSSLKELHWCIVEQAHFVNCGKEYFEDEHLKFYYTIEECLSDYKPNVLLLSSVLQYLEQPYEWLKKFIDLDIPFIILDRTAFIDDEEDILSLQRVPEKIYSASYPAWFFNFEKILKTIALKYKIVLEFEDAFTNKTTLMGRTCFWKGLILKKTNEPT